MKEPSSIVVKTLIISTIVDVLYANSRISVVKTLIISTIVDNPSEEEYLPCLYLVISVIKTIFTE